MSLRTLETAILKELRVVTKNPKLRLKDIMEWSTGPVQPRTDEEVFYLPDLKVYVAVR